MIHRISGATLLSPFTLTLFAVCWIPIASAEQSATVTLAANAFLNLDTGVVSTNGGDVLWDGETLTPWGRAGVYNLGKYGARAFKSITARHAPTVQYGSAPIVGSALVAGDIFGVRTNSGRYAKVLVTASGGGSLTLQYTNFNATVNAAGPLAAGATITKVQNNYSYLVPGVPNYGIAPGSLFVVFGTGLSGAAPPVLQSSAAPGLPKTLNQTSVSVTVGGVTTTPSLYYTSAGAVAAVLPSTTPVGTGTVTVTYNGQASNAAPIQIVASAIGLDTLYGTGNGAGVATDTNGKVLGFTNSGTPGQTITLWGSGIGADTASDDRTFPQGLNNLTNVPTQVFIGGTTATVLYRGRSQFPGLDQYNVTIPPNVTPGCFVSVVALTGAIPSNTVTLPISANGGACSDAVTGLNGTQMQALANKGAGGVKSIAAIITQSNHPQGRVDSGGFVIAGAVQSALFGSGYEYVSQGSCVIVPPGQGDFSNVFLSTLDAGALTLIAPGGTVNLSGQGGFAQGALPAPLTSAPGAYTFNAAGGKDVGSFKVSVNVQSPLTLSNLPALATITRSQGATVTWSGGFPNGDVQIQGGVGGSYGTVRFFCHAPTSAGQFTVPASILLGMPATSGNLVITNTTAIQTVPASGADVVLAGAALNIVLTPTYK